MSRFALGYYSKKKKEEKGDKRKKGYMKQVLQNVRTLESGGFIILFSLLSCIFETFIIKR